MYAINEKKVRIKQLGFHPIMVREHVMQTTAHASRKPRRQKVTLSDIALAFTCFGAVSYFLF